MKTAGGNIGKTNTTEDKIVRVDATESELDGNPVQKVLGVNELLPQLSILQLSDVGLKTKKTFKGKAGKALIVGEDERSIEFGNAGGGGNATPITLTYAANLTVDLGQNLNYILTLTGDCVLDLTNIIPGYVYQFLIIQDSAGMHELSFNQYMYFIEGYNQDLNANSVSKLIIDYVDGRYFASISKFISDLEPGIYHSAEKGLISVSADGENWITMADKNLGATTVWNYGDAFTDANCGKLYQWGNNYGFPRTGNITTSNVQVDASNYGPGNYYSSSTYITGGTWDSSNNSNLWGHDTGTLEARRGPCDLGWHIPNYNEIIAIGGTMGIEYGRDASRLYLMPHGGIRDKNGQPMSNRGDFRGDEYSSGQGTFCINYPRGFGFAWWDTTYGLYIRPFKNTPVIPDKSWTKMI